MARKKTYADWLRDGQANLNGTLFGAQPATGVNGYAGLMARNAEIANTPETTPIANTPETTPETERVGYSVLASGHYAPSAIQNQQLAQGIISPPSSAPTSPYAQPATPWDWTPQWAREMRDRQNVNRFKQFASNAVKNAPTLAENFGYGLYNAAQEAAKKAARIEQGTKNGGDYGYTPTIKEQAQSKAEANPNNPTGSIYHQLLTQGILKQKEARDKLGNALSSFADLVRPTTSKALQTMKQARDKLAEAESQKTETNPAPTTEATAAGTTNVGTPSAGTTAAELTGYAKFLADHPEYAEANRLAEAEYARSLPTYGALAEQMAQAGIHGGYSDYLQGVAYAKMQDAKQQNEEAARQGYKDYLVQQEAALTGNGGTVMSDTAKELYKNLLSEYGDQIAGIKDEKQYTQFEDLFRAANKGLYSDADIESALKQAREYRTTQKSIDTATVSQGIADYTTGDGGDNDLLRSLGYDPATFIDPQGEEESDEDYAKRYGKAFIAAVNEAYKAKRIDKPQHSAILTTAMPISDEDFDTMDWKNKGVSIAASIDLAINGDLTDEDYAKVVEKVKEKLKSVGLTSIYYDHQGIGRSSNLDIKIRGGAKNYEDIHADQVGGDITQAEKNKLAEYKDLPLAYLVNSDGTTTLYYQNEHGWRQLKTKGGSTDGSPKLGNNWYKAIAFLMMNGNKPTETITTSKNRTYNFITN